MKRLLLALFLLVGVLLTIWPQTTLPSNPLLEGTYPGIDGKPYIALTDAQIQAWLKTVTPEVLFGSLRKLDLIEHVQPTATVPDAVIGLTKDRSIFLAWADPGKLTLDVAGELSYSIKLDAKEFKGLAPAESPLKIIVATAIGLIAASVMQYAEGEIGITKVTPIGSIGISVAIGGGLSGLVYALWPSK